MYKKEQIKQYIKISNCFFVVLKFKKLFVMRENLRFEADKKNQLHFHVELGNLHRAMKK